MGSKFYMLYIGGSITSVFPPNASQAVAFVAHCLAYDSHVTWLVVSFSFSVFLFSILHIAYCSTMKRRFEPWENYSPPRQPTASYFDRLKELLSDDSPVESHDISTGDNEAYDAAPSAVSRTAAGTAPAGQGVDVKSPQHAPRASADITGPQALQAQTQMLTGTPAFLMELLSAPADGDGLDSGPEDAMAASSRACLNSSPAGSAHSLQDKPATAHPCAALQLGISHSIGTDESAAPSVGSVAPSDVVRSHTEVRSPETRNSFSGSAATSVVRSLEVRSPEARSSFIGSAATSVVRSPEVESPAVRSPSGESAATLVVRSPSAQKGAPSDVRSPSCGSAATLVVRSPSVGSAATLVVRSPSARRSQSIESAATLVVESPSDKDTAAWQVTSPPAAAPALDIPEDDPHSDYFDRSWCAEWFAEEARKAAAPQLAWEKEKQRKELERLDYEILMAASLPAPPEASASSTDAPAPCKQYPMPRESTSGLYSPLACFDWPQQWWRCDSFWKAVGNDITHFKQQLGNRLDVAVCKLMFAI